MSYCVNCGVELEKSQRQCPLCAVEVVNPREPHDPDLPKPYSVHIVSVQARLERRYMAWIATILMILAVVVCAMANLVYDGAITWSAYVIASLALVWVVLMFPLLAAGIHPAVMVLLDACAVLAFLYVLNEVDTTADWYMQLAMPQVLLYGVIGLCDVVLWRSKRVYGWQRYGIVVMSLGIAMMGLEVLLDLYNDMIVRLQWSWFVVIPAMALGLILFLLERKREIKDEIIKRLHV